MAAVVHDAVPSTEIENVLVDQFFPSTPPNATDTAIARNTRTAETNRISDLL
jgi:hypothetical protein